MKNFIILMLITSVGLVACKKGEKSSPRLDKPISEGIKGVWLTTSQTHEYFNSNNEKIFTRTVEPGWNYSIDDVFKLTNPLGERLVRADYTITNSNGKNYFSFTSNGITETYEITSLQQETMSWRQEKANVTYNDNGEKLAAKEITTLNFHCPCK